MAPITLTFQTDELLSGLRSVDKRLQLKSIMKSIGKFSSTNVPTKVLDYVGTLLTDDVDNVQFAFNENVENGVVIAIYADDKCKSLLMINQDGEWVEG